MLFGFNQGIWLYREPVDFRKQIDGLSLIVADALSCDPTSGEVFVFRNRSGNKVKLLWWDEHGFWLMYKRLEKSRFKFPSQGDKVWSLSKQQFVWLLSGLPITQQNDWEETKASTFY